MADSTQEKNKSQKRQKTLKILVFSLIMLLYGCVLAHKINLPVADDLPRQIKIGEEIVHGNFDILYKNVFSYAEPDQTFFDHHWLSGVVFYFLNLIGGWVGLVIFKIIILLAAFLIIFKVALKKANFWLVAFLSLPAIIILHERTGLRPEVFSYLFIAIYLYLLVHLDEHPESKKIYWLIPLQLLWVNMHVFFSVGIMMTAGYLFEKIVLTPPDHFSKKFSKEFFRNVIHNKIVQKVFIIFVALCLVSIINPRGLSGVFYHYPGANFPVSISENQSIMNFIRGQTFWYDISIAIFFPAVALSIISYFFAFRKNKRPIFYFLASLSTAVLSFIIIRSISFFALLFIPVVSSNLNDAFNNFLAAFAKESLKIKKIVSAFVVIVFIGTLCYLIYPGWVKLSEFKDRGVGLAYRSEESANFFIKNNLHGPIINDSDSGSYLIYYLYPKERVFVDNRFADAYSTDIYNQSVNMTADEQDWQRALAKYNFNVIFFYQYDAGPNIRQFLFRRTQDPSWSLVYVDIYNIILVRNTPENKDIIDRYGITRDNILTRLDYLINSDNLDDKITAADTLNLVGLTDVGTKVFLDVVSKDPTNAKVWMILGEWELNKNDPRSPILAAMFLDKAISMGRDTAEAYSYLGAAYVKLSRPENARAALKKALSINPDREDAKKLLEQIGEGN